MLYLYRYILFITIEKSINFNNKKIYNFKKKYIYIYI